MRRSALALLVGGGGLLLGLILLLLPLDIEQSLGLPTLFHWRGTTAAPKDVLIVALEQGSARRLSLPAAYNRWPRQHHARLIDNLARAGARLIVYDVLFGDNALQSTGDTDALAAAIRRAGNVVLTSSLDNLSHEAADPPPSAGITELRPRDDAQRDVATIRRCREPVDELGAAALGVAPFVLPPQSQRADNFWIRNAIPCASPTLPALVLQAYAADQWPDFLTLARSTTADGGQSIADLPAIGDPTMTAMRRLLAGRPRLAVRVAEAIEASAATPGSEPGRRRELRALLGLYAGPEARYLNPIGPALSFPTIAFADAVTADEDSGRWQSFVTRIAGRVVFVGASELAIEDQKNSTDAFNTVYDVPSGLRLQGVEILTTAFVNLLDARDLRRSGLATSLLIVATECALLAMFWALLPLRIAAAATAALLCAYALFCLHRFETSSQWLPLVTPILVSLLAMPLAWLGRYLSLVRERRQILRAVRRRLPPGVSSEYLRTGHVNRVVDGVCLSSDVGNWTRLAAQVTGAELGERMRRYIASMFECVERHGGYPVDSAGDGMLAIWVDADQAGIDRRRRACHAALEALRLGSSALEVGGKALPTRIGICAGELALRDIGGETQFQVKPFGLTVNVTSRIEALNKRLGTRILATIDTTDGLGEFQWRPLGRFMVEGIEQPIAIAELSGLREHATPQQRRLGELFAVAMRCWEARQIEDASRTLRQVLDIDPGDGPAAFYLQCIAAIDPRAPHATWSAVVRIDKDGTTYPAANRHEAPHG